MLQKSLFIVISICLSATSAVGQDLRVLNSSSPGERFELTQYLERNTTNILVFRSQHSPSCLMLEERLKDLYRGRDDVVVRLVDIDRKGSAEIDWRSPLVRQYNLKTVPYIYMINGQGTTISQGYEARKDILEMLDAL